ncbi:spore cortex-lytic enzyme [Alicyclobacillus kakegawensis]|uniref:spore cortex-lytic enzyme n=1 Tax=Alicyclobacillus kakegawensis TaxID=392012 RepID=UPI000B014C1D|nr:spore cortex-lytic enzyme [Alicyclobacillus kakegawensis]
MLKKLKWMGLLGAALLTLWQPAMNASRVEAFTARNLQYGSQGYDVDELQNRLKFLGYYHGKVDGIFGWDTYWAVRDFQYRFGMKPTGLVDMHTKMMLVKATKNWHYRGPLPAKPRATGAAGEQLPPTVGGISQSDINLLAHLVYGEARGEPFVGQVAVAAVVLNRVKSDKFPNTVAGVIYHPGAFTCVSDGQFNLQPNKQAYQAALDAAHGWDPSHGALYYYNPKKSQNGFMIRRPKIVTIGDHIFTR